MVKPIPTELVEEIRSRVNIVEIIDEYVPLRKKGKNFVGLCPFHAEKSPSFTVTPEKQVYYCFGCGTGGDVFGFLMKYQQLDFPEAVSFLAGRLGINLPTQKHEASINHWQRYYDLNALAARFFHHLLLHHPTGELARRYLHKRGISEETAAKFSVGYAPGNGKTLLRFLLRRNYSLEELVRVGLVLVGKNKRNHYARFRHRLLFPICDPGGRIVGFGARALSEQAGPKYLNSPETVLFQKKRILYALPQALPAIRREGQAVIVEGYLDALTAYQFGFTNIVASLGTAFSGDQARLLARYAKEIVIAYDADAAGEAATFRGLELLRDEGCRVKIAMLPVRADPDSFLRQEGAQAFQELIGSKALSLIEYKFKLAREKHNLTTTEGKVAALTGLLADLAKISNAVEQEERIRYLARELAVSEMSIATEIQKYTKKIQEQDKKVKNSYNRGESISHTPQPAYRQAEKNLIRLMLRDVEMGTRIVAELGIDGFISSEIKYLVGEWKQICQGDPQPDPVKLMDRLVNEEAKSLVAELLLSESRETFLQEALADNLKIIKLYRLARQIQEKQEALSKAEQLGDTVSVKKLLSEVSSLQQTVQQLKHSRSPG